jgi:fatty-acyl-CoA synthase
VSGRRPGWTRRWGRPLLWTLFLIGVSPVLIVAMGAIGTKLGWWSWTTGLGEMTFGWAPKAALAGVSAGLLAILIAVLAGARRLWAAVAIALITPLLTLAALNQTRQTAKNWPGHDVSTDVGDPPMPSAALLRIRGPEANPIERDPRSDPAKGRPEIENWADNRVLRAAADRCPEARTVRLQVTPAEAYARAGAAAGAVAAELLTEAPQAGVLEAVHESFWFEFKDDVMIRVRPEGAGSRIDVRSVSRVGGSDLGANCARVTRIVRALRKDAGG